MAWWRRSACGHHTRAADSTAVTAPATSASPAAVAAAPPPLSSVSRVIDGQLSYLIMNWFARVLVNYRHASIDLGGGAVEDDRLLLGVQLWDP
jgi:hypothetical protein